jgi:hypothetical protein
MVICSEIRDEENRPVGARAEIRLPGLITPGRPQAAALPIELPANLGSYRLTLWAENAGGEGTTPVEIALTVAVNAGDRRTTTCAAALLDTVQETLPKAHQLQQLPADYVDVTEGALAPVKRLIKQKLLNNFKHAYVDVLSRQQSQVNGHLVVMIQQLAECCAMLDHAVAGLSQRLDVLEAKLEQSPSTPNPGFAEIIDT